MSESKTEVMVGAVIVAVAAGFLVYAGKTTGMTRAGGEYQLSASFRSADGVSVGTDVRLAGVKIGRVTEIGLDSETFQARTVFTVQEGISLPDDSAIAISSEGLLGGNFVEVLPGASPFFFQPGDEVELTQGSVGLVSLLMKFVSGGEEAAPK